MYLKKLCLCYTVIQNTHLMCFLTFSSSVLFRELFKSCVDTDDRFDLATKWVPNSILTRRYHIIRGRVVIPVSPPVTFVSCARGPKYARIVKLA